MICLCSTVEQSSTVEQYGGVIMKNKVNIKSMNDFKFDDNLSKLVSKYEPEELSLDDLDLVAAASNHPDYNKFLDVLNKEEK